MKLRQCVFVCKDLESSREELCDILGIEVAYRDPGVAKWGLVNVVCPIGHDFLEIVTPEQPGTSAGRYIERRKGDGGYMVIIQVPDARGRAGARHRARRARRRPEGSARIQLHPLPSVRHVGRAAVARHDLRAAGRRSQTAVAAGREGLAEACALGRHQRAGRRRDPAPRIRTRLPLIGRSCSIVRRRTTSSASTMMARSASRRSSTAAGPACRPTTSRWSTASASWRLPRSAAGSAGRLRSRSAAAALMESP